jgi:hypothetical protein
MSWSDWEILFKRLDRIELKLTQIQEVQVAQAQQINASLDDLNAKTDEAAARLREIISSLHPGMTQEEVDAITAKIDAQATRLSGWGIDA